MGGPQPVVRGAPADDATDTAAAASPPRRAAAMRFILIAVLIDIIAIGVMIPVLPHLVGQFTSSAVEQNYWYGAVSFAFAFANFFGSPVLGALSDAHGRRPVLLLGFTGLALSFFVTAQATALWMLIAVRLVAGAMQSNAAVANAYVADITDPAHRARHFGMIGAAFGAGFTIGPMLGGWLGAQDLHLPFYVSGVLALINALYGWRVLPESLPPERRRPVDWRRANPVHALHGLTQLQGVGPLVAIVACSGLAQFVLHVVWVLYGSYRFGWGPAENGGSLFAVGVMSIIVQGGLLRHLLKRWSAATLVQWGLVSSTLAFVGWGLSTAPWMLYAVMAANLLGFAVNTAVQSLISQAADARSQGATLGAVAALNSLMAVLAPVIGAVLQAWGAHFPRDHLLVGLPFFFCALLQLCSTLIAWRHFRRHPELTARPAAAA
ncbi:MAG: hypothetical protein RL223_3759 [Pseudomonadota bacterium]